MIASETKIRVRYAEVDRMGYLHHGNYASYFEQARTDLIRKIGMSYREIEDHGIAMPVRDMHIRFLYPAGYDEVLTIHTTLRNRPKVRLEFEYQVYNEKGTLICEASTILVFTNSESRKPVRMPDFFIPLIAPYFK